MAERKSRRRFLAEGALALAGVAAGASGEAHAAPDAGTKPTGTGSIFSGTPAEGAGPAGPTVTPDDFAHAEKLMRVSMTPEQRTLAADSWNLNVGPFFVRRDFPLGDESPGMVWNPVLQGTGRMPKKNRVVRSSWTSRRPPTDDELAFAPVHALARWVQARQVSSVRLTELALARLERYQPQLNCTITLVREQALAEAEAADREIARGKYRGPLHGIPYGAKDLLDTAGIRTTWGAEPFRNRVPKEDATVIARLRAAGAILVAKLSLGCAGAERRLVRWAYQQPLVPRGGLGRVERRLRGGGLRGPGAVRDRQRDLRQHRRTRACAAGPPGCARPSVASRAPGR